MLSTYRVDLTTIEGEGDFSCPKCGAQISPDDETETAYTIVETIIGNDDELESMIIRCNKCESMINIEGFDTYAAEQDVRAHVSDALPDSDPGLQTRHTLTWEGQDVGTVIVEYAQKADKKAFKRLRKLRVGAPFKSKVMINEVSLENDGHLEIARVVKRKFKGLRERDVYIIEKTGGQQNLVGRF
jgi:predicted RNA-binding Zn-ribbon protein involved in translation (DUF1610 family)